MARKSAMEQVLGQQIPVFPDGSQSPYYRSANNTVTSQKLSQRNSCVAEQLEGSSPGNRQAAREQFSDAVQNCKSQGR